MPQQLPAGAVPLNQQIASDGTIISQPSTPVAAAPPSQLTKETSNEQHTENPPASSNAGGDGTNIEGAKTGEASPPASAEHPGDDNPVVDISDFLDVKNINRQAEPKPKPGEKVIDEAGNRITSDKTKVLPEARDYSDIPEEDKPIFEKMSNDAFAKLKPIYLERKAKDAEIEALKKGRIPDSYMEHPNAVVLTPEFESTSRDVNYANTIAKHWEEQFDKVKAGEAEYTNILMNDKGELYLSEPIKVDRTSETRLLKLVTWAQTQAQTQQANLHNLIKTHRDRSAETINWVKDYEKKAFSVFDKDEGKTLKAIAEDTIRAFPKAYHNNPLMGMLAKAMTMSMMLGKQLQTLNGKGAQPAGGKTATKTNGNLSAAEIAGDVGGGGATKTVLGESFEDFQKYKEGMPL